MAIRELPDALHHAYTLPTGSESSESVIQEVRRTYPVSPPPGVSGRTWRRLRADPGRKVLPRIRDALRAAQRDLRAGAVRQRIGRGARITVTGWVRVSEEERYRTLDSQAWLKAGPAGDLARRVLDHLSRGEAGSAADDVTGSLGRAIGQTIEITAHPSLPTTSKARGVKVQLSQPKKRRK